MLKRTAKDIIQYALYRDYANEMSNTSKFINIPKNNDMIEVLDAISDLVNFGEKNGITLLATTMNGYRQALLSGYDAIWLYDYLGVEYNESPYVSSRSSEFCVKKQITGGYKHLVLQSVDTMSTQLLKGIINNMYHNSILYVLYDSTTNKKFLGKEIAEIMYRFTSYEVEKLNRDKYNTSLILYNIRNNIRRKKFELESFLNDSTNKEPHFYINELNNINNNPESILPLIHKDIPIITPSIQTMISVTNTIRRHFNLEHDDNECIPQVNEWLVTHQPALAWGPNNRSIILPMGYRFQIKSIIPNPEQTVWTAYFDYMDPRTGELIDANIAISLEYIEYLYNGSNSEVFEKESKEPYGCNKVFFGYCIPSHISLDQTYDDAMVIINPDVFFHKTDLYTCVVPIQNSLRLIIDNTF